MEATEPAQPPNPSRKKRVSMAPILLTQITELFQDAGANKVEARCALEAAMAMIPEMDLKDKMDVLS